MLALLLSACAKQSPVEPSNAVYFWRTEFRLDSTEWTFLSRYQISTIYCRYFDVVMNDTTPIPNATLAFADTIPAGVAFVPTVYITEDCMHQWHEGLARKIVDRVVQMNATNDIRGIVELQMDCDYTDRSRRHFYTFLEQVRSEARRHGMRLSVTIRLHQLQMPAPPADYGVLMLYNTGDPRNFEQRNPILDHRDVEPYMRHLPDYPLPLAAAYPVYRWQRQMQGVRIEHTVEASEILGVKKMVESMRPDLSRRIIVYHLDEENINRYDNDTYEAIFHH